MIISPVLYQASQFGFLSILLCLACVVALLWMEFQIPVPQIAPATLSTGPYIVTRGRRTVRRDTVASVRLHQEMYRMRVLARQLQLRGVVVA